MSRPMALWRRKPMYAGIDRRKSRRWTPRRARFLLFCLAVVGMCYVSAVIWLMTQETRLVFQAGATMAPNRPSFPYEQVDLPRTHGAKQFGWVMRHGASDDGPWVLYLHGNAATIASMVNISHYRQLRTLGLNVFAPEYRGFAGLDGLPTEASLAADADAAYHYLRAVRHVAPHRIVIYGWSLGAAVAVRLASDVEQAAVILEGAPASLVSLGQERYPFFPIRMIMKNPFEAITRIERITAPILFLHSPEDVVIPIAQGRRLFDAARAPKVFVEVRGGHVNASEIDAEQFVGSIRPFLVQHGLLTASTPPAEDR